MDFKKYTKMLKIAQKQQKSIAKILTPLLGTISSSHLKSSSNLFKKIQNINKENKLTTSLYIQSIYTNIPIKKCIPQLKFP